MPEPPILFIPGMKLEDFPSLCLNPEPSSRKSITLAGRFLAVLCTGFKSGHKVCDYAKELAVSQASLRQACRDEMRFCPCTCVELRRVLEAARLLSSTGMNIGEVADKAGFSSPSYFIQVFKSLTGTTPGKWANEAFRLRQQEAAAKRNDF